MAKSKESFERRQREQAKKAKANAKRERRLTKDEEESGDEPVAGEQPQQAAVLAELETLHAAFDEGSIKFDDFEERRAALLAQLDLG